MLVKITMEGASIKAQDLRTGNAIPFNQAGKTFPTLWINTARKAFDEGMGFTLDESTSSKWIKTPIKDIERQAADLNASTVNVPEEQAELMAFIQASTELRPEVMKMADIKWKYLMRCAMRGKNILMTGPAGCGKTMAAKSVVNALDRPDFYFNLGATQF